MTSWPSPSRQRAPPFAVGRGLDHDPGAGPGPEDGAEALRLGPDAPLEDLAALGEDVDLAFPLVHVDANMVHGWPLLSAALTARCSCGAAYATTSKREASRFLHLRARRRERQHSARDLVGRAVPIDDDEFHRFQPIRSQTAWPVTSSRSRPLVTRAAQRMAGRERCLGPGISGGGPVPRARLLDMPRAVEGLAYRALGRPLGGRSRRRGQRGHQARGR